MDMDMDMDMALPPFEPLEPIPRFGLDLDAPPLERWAPIVAAYRERFDGLRERNVELFGQLESARGFLPLSLLLRMLPETQRDDVRALASLLGVALGTLAIINVVYEAFALTDLLTGTCGCTTSVLGCEDGVVHGRTLDWSWLEGLDEVVVDLEVHRSGRPLYVCTSFVGFVGVLTGMARRDEAAGLSVSINYRRPFRGTWAGDEPRLDVPPIYRNGWLGTALLQALRGGWTAAGLLRHVLESELEYGGALEAVRAARLLAPCYVTIAGAAPGEGVILACDVGVGKHETSLRESTCICVANTDVHESPSGRDEGPRGAAAAKDFVQGESWLRRDMALEALRRGAPGGEAREQVSRALAAAGAACGTCEDGATLLWSVLESPPIANEATVYTTLMCSAHDHYASARSIGPLAMAAHGFDTLGRERYICRTCCAQGCRKKTACANGRERAETGPGSILRRLGGGYYCRDHLPLDTIGSQRK